MGSPGNLSWWDDLIQVKPDLSYIAMTISITHLRKSFALIQHQLQIPFGSSEQANFVPENLHFWHVLTD
jgi:hypothetical protein